MTRETVHNNSDRLPQARASLIHSFQDALRQPIVERPGMHTGVYALVREYADAYSVQHNRDPLAAAVGYSHRFHHFINEDPGNLSLQLLRDERYQRFVEPFDVVDNLPVPHQVIAWSVATPAHYQPSVWRQIQHLFTTNKGHARRRAQLAESYLTLACGPEGFSAEQPTFAGLAIADLFLHRARTHYYKLEDYWWFKHFRDMTVEEKYKTRDQMRAVLQAAFNDAGLPAWQRLLQTPIELSEQRLTEVAVADYEAMNEIGNKPAIPFDQVRLPGLFQALAS